MFLTRDSRDLGQFLLRRSILLVWVAWPPLQTGRVSGLGSRDTTLRPTCILFLVSLVSLDLLLTIVLGNTEVASWACNERRRMV